MTEIGRHRDAMEIFVHVCDLDETAQRNAIARRCAGNAALQQQVESLLSYDGAENELLDAVEAGRGPDLFAPDFLEMADSDVPTRIGDYRVIRVLGEGGMGVIYEAEQDTPKRRVALKVLRPTLINRQLIRRFQHEAQVLGQLQHPGIAQIYEGGFIAARSGRQPYCAMELVDGEPIDQHTRECELTVPERLELVARICDAVHYAHQKGIIHRDLKPSNVLVVKHDPPAEVHSRGKTGQLARLSNVGQPKVLDFGIARVTNQDVQAITVETEIGQLIGTLAYMSPEQIDGKSSDLDTRCDIYALGIMLYELLAGRRPHDLADKPLPEAARIVREEDPPRLGSLDKALRGDVETIAAKAMEKERDRRYASAAAFAADIRRHLSDEPIEARPASTLYQLSKFSRRNRGLVIGVGVGLVAMTTGLVAASAGWYSAHTQSKAKDEALYAEQMAVLAKDEALVAKDEALVARTEAFDEERVSREASEEVTDFFRGLLASATPSNDGRDVTVLEVMDRASRDIEGMYPRRPIVEARVRMTLAQTYVGLGDLAKAEQQAQRALEIVEKAPKQRHKDLSAALTIAGAIHYYRGRHAQATMAAERALAHARLVDPPDERNLARALANIGVLATASGQLDLAEQRLLEAAPLMERAVGPNDRLALGVQGDLAWLYSLTGRNDKAEALYQDLISRSQEVLGEDDPETLVLLTSLASVYLNHGRASEAIPLLKHALAAQEEVLGRGHRQTLITLSNLGGALSMAGQLDEAGALLEDGLARARAALGHNSVEARMLLQALARIHFAAEDFDRAEQALLESLELNRQLGDHNALGTALVCHRLAEFYLQRSNNEAALELAAESAGILRGAGVPENNRRVVDARLQMALALIGLGRFEEAEPLLLDIHATGPHVGIDAAAMIVGLYRSWGRPDRAEEWEQRR